MNTPKQSEQPAFFKDIDEFVDIEKNDPERFTEIIRKHAERIRKNIRRSSKEKGIPITYRDNEYPGCLIQEEAGGRRFIIRLNPEKNYCTEIVREIPPSKEEEEEQALAINPS